MWTVLWGMVRLKKAIFFPWLHWNFMVQWGGKWPAAWIFAIWPSEKWSSFLIPIWFPLTSILLLPLSPPLASCIQLTSDPGQNSLESEWRKMWPFVSLVLSRNPHISLAPAPCRKAVAFPRGWNPPNSSVWIASEECMAWPAWGEVLLSISVLNGMPALSGNKLRSQNCLAQTVLGVTKAVCWLQHHRWVTIWLSALASLSAHSGWT